ncbi:hypothetical protein [Streptomyces sp. WM6378]|uniref:hypothetical protein n=1 Tax=Streptomyces sp. WM6378 TaxID=1415557 RepID=UPI0006ADA6C5|nr:hypothetical protein [Streptomyces sp. WM6378]KOU44266.1 hypothetical protein ADK54_16290 [Streptomyces sp. WM6378]
MSERRASRFTGAGLPRGSTGAGSPPVLRGDAHRGDETIHKVRAVIRSHGLPTVERGWPPPPAPHPPTAAQLAASFKENGRLVLAVPGPDDNRRPYGDGTDPVDTRVSTGQSSAADADPDTRVWLTVPSCAADGHETGCRCDPELAGAFVRTVFPGWLVAAADTRLRTAVRAYQEHYAPVDDLSAVGALAGSFADVLLADCVVGAATDALRAGTGRRALTAVCGHLVPRLLREGAEEVIPLNARRRDGSLARSAYDFSAAREGEALMAAAGPVGARLPQLLAEFQPGSTGRELRLLGREFRDFSGLPDGRDPVGGSFREVIRMLNRELRGLERRRSYLGRPTPGGPDPAALAVADRLALLTAAACGLGRLRFTGEDTDRAWLLLALTRVLRRLGHSTPRLPRGQVGLVLKELIVRDREALAYDLSRERIDLEIGSTA